MHLIELVDIQFSKHGFLLHVAKCRILFSNIN